MWYIKIVSNLKKGFVTGQVNKFVITLTGVISKLNQMVPANKSQ